MCGRFTHLLTYRQLRELYLITEPEIGPGQPEPDLKPRYNMAPTQLAPVVRLSKAGQRELAMMRWGLIPFWAKDEKIAYKTINARAETVAAAPSFRAAFEARRCLVPASGFYEWKKLPDGGKQPYHIGMRDGLPLTFAGLWERWDKGPVPLETFTIITGDPNSLTAEIHNRMPVILEPDDWDGWLTGSDPAALQKMLRPFPAQLIAAYPISTRVNSPRNDAPDIIDPVS